MLSVTDNDFSRHSDHIPFCLPCLHVVVLMWNLKKSTIGQKRKNEATDEPFNSNVAWSNPGMMNNNWNVNDIISYFMPIIKSICTLNCFIG